MLEKKVILSTGGFVVKDLFLNRQKIDFKTSPVRINIGFISSAVASMINDKPKVEDVTQDVTNLKILSTDSLKSYKLTDFIIEQAIKSNLEIIKEYFNFLNLFFDSYKSDIKDLKISSLSKCGALIDDGFIKQVRIMGINDSHILQFDRDFIGYFLNFSFSGKVLFFYQKKPVEPKINFAFNKIPLLSFKSENAFKNQPNKKVTSDMLKKLTNQNISEYFL
ncbi:MAG TPA: hypothetical protein PK771_08110 [Spirochaetota bacterium]|nr:hypothetical protein [Spirochaetota bacterium]